MNESICYVIISVYEEKIEGVCAVQLTQEECREVAYSKAREMALQNNSNAPSGCYLDYSGNDMFYYNTAPSGVNCNASRWYICHCRNGKPFAQNVLWGFIFQYGKPVTKTFLRWKIRSATHFFGGKFVQSFFALKTSLRPVFLSVEKFHQISSNINKYRKI